MYKRILLAYDGSASGQQALLNMRDLAMWEHPRITLVAVMPTAEPEPGSIETGYLVNTSRTELEAKLKDQLRKGVKRFAPWALKQTESYSMGK